MTTLANENSVEAIGKILVDKTKPLKDRFRALFTLRNIGGEKAIDFISSCFDDTSALLKHELAYCLGQMQDKYALGVLSHVLADRTQEPMVRHEAGEALGAIGAQESISVLKEYENDPVIEVAETCQLALQRLNWLNNQQDEKNLLPNPYKSVDPAPSTSKMEITELENILLDESLPLFQRYRAMFSLRNLGTTEAVKALAKGLKSSSALFRHEIAYVLGQIQSDACVNELKANLQNMKENPMVRHECAEALGSIATPECTRILEDYLKDNERVVKESCIVALDISEYENSDQFQYADGLAKLNTVKS
ncbi:deoxyhypusine hydroxylase-like [Saccostrea echinata]|uniref:deoxyhypusine hydroxylase-like n=1 Tax=Saccostrea echinata TaxID=191078 RepID=UPI002A8201A0|nr:deoxyhypusine hydroxylase-like [Saccostrea echinata]